MSKLDRIKRLLRALSPQKWAIARVLAAFDWAAWDRQLERDAAAGKLDAAGEKALRDHAAGRSKRL